MSELNDVAGGETITSTFTNEVKERSLMRYADATARDASILAPIAGSLAWLEDLSEITVYDGAVWRVVALGEFLPIDGSVPMQGTIDMASNQIIQVSELHTEVGSVGAPSHSFGSDPNSGMYRFGVDRVAIATGGSDVIQLYAPADSSSRCVLQLGTTGIAANLFQTGSLALPGVQLSTSARKYKTNIVSLAASLLTVDLEPVAFHRNDDDADFIGFIADDMPDERMIIRDTDGEVENYDVRAVVAVLAGQVNNLRARVATLEAAV